SHAGGGIVHTQLRMPRNYDQAIVGATHEDCEGCWLRRNVRGPLNVRRLTALNSLQLSLAGDAPSRIVSRDSGWGDGAAPDEGPGLGLLAVENPGFLFIYLAGHAAGPCRARRGLRESLRWPQHRQSIGKKER